MAGIYIVFQIFYRGVKIILRHLNVKIDIQSKRLKMITELDTLEFIAVHIIYFKMMKIIRLTSVL